MKILVSACLLGINCRYDGESKSYPKIERILEKFDVIPFCPEIYGGLSTPREPSEIYFSNQKNLKVLTKNGLDVTKEYKNGANKALDICRLLNITVALLKDKSPSCGKTIIYDGTFSSTLIDGNGVTASLLMKNGIKVFCESEIDLLLNLNK